MRTTIIFVSCLLGTRYVGGLTCFSCVRGRSVGECMENHPHTCGWGRICYTTVEKGSGGISGTGDLYTKGCMEADHCYSLENINHRKTCVEDPSICVYCCTGSLCNTAVTSLPTGCIFYTLTTIMIFHYNI